MAIGTNHSDMPDSQKIMVGKRLKMEALEKLGRESGVHSEEDEYGRKKVDEMQGKENPYGLDAWRKKMLRRLG